MARTLYPDAKGLIEAVRLDARRVRTKLEHVGGVLRHDPATRLLHWWLIGSFFLLLHTGLVAYYPVLGLPFAGQKGALLAHRVTGAAFALPFAWFTLLHRERVLRFLSQVLVWRPRDLLWLLLFPAYLLAHRRVQLPPAREKLNPGEKLIQLIIWAALAVLTVSGWMRFPPDIPAALAARAEDVHRLATLIVVIPVAGHIFMGSGVHPAFRGVWRATLGDGVIPLRLAREHWPVWLEEKQAGLPHPGKPAAYTLRGVAVAAALFAAAVLAHSFPFPARRAPLYRAETLPEGVFRVRSSPEAFTVDIRRGKIDFTGDDDRPVRSWQAKEMVMKTLWEREGLESTE